MNTVVETINAAGRAFVDLALPMLIQSSVLILILLMVDVILRRKVRAVFRYWIWMLVLVKLVLPPSLGSPVSIGTWFGERLEVPAAAPEATELSPTMSAILAPPDPWIAQPPEPLAAVPLASAMPIEMGPPAAAETNTVVPPPVVSLSWQGLALVVWSAVASALTLLLVQRAFFVRGLIGQAAPADRILLDELEGCRRRVGLRRAVGLRLSPNAASPAVCGLFRPVILIPQNLAPRLHAQDRQAVLLHELAHVQRSDLWVNLAQTLLQIVYFYNPLVWLANAMIRRTREQAVDEAVLVAMGETARQYPETLVNIAKLAFTRRPALSLRLIGVVESKSALTGRIKHMLSRPLPKTAKLGLLGLVIVFVIATVLLPMAKADRRPETFRAEGGALDLQLVGVCADGDDEIYDPNGTRLGRRLGVVDAAQMSWGQKRQRCDFVFELPTDHEQFMPADAHIIGPARERKALGFSATPLWLYPREGPELLVISTAILPRMHEVGVLRRREMPIEKVDLTLRYYYGPPRDYVCTFTGPFVPGKPVRADGNSGYEVTFAPLPFSSDAAEVRFHISPPRGFDGDTTALLYDTDGRRYPPTSPWTLDRGQRQLFYRHQGVPLSRIKTITIGEKPQTTTFRNVAIHSPARPACDYAAYLDAMAERLGRKDLSSRQLAAYQFQSSEEAIAVLDVLQDRRLIQAAIQSLSPGARTLDLSTLDPEVRERVHTAATRWAQGPDLCIRACGIQLGLLGRWPEFFDQALQMLASDYAHLAPADCRDLRQDLARVVLTLLQGSRSRLSPDQFQRLADFQVGQRDLPVQPPAGESQFKATLPNGATVELIALREQSSGGRQWWQPDGEILSAPPYECPGATVGSPQGGWYEVVFRMDGGTSEAFAEMRWASRQNRPRARLQPVRSASSIRAGRPAPGEEDLFKAVLFIDPNASHVQIDLGVGVEDAWQQYGMLDGRVPRGGAMLPGAIIDPPSEKEGLTFVTVAHHLLDRELRFVAVDWKGAVHKARKNSNAIGDEVGTYRAGFELPLDDIQWIRLETQKLSRVVFANVSLRPGARTNVEVRPQVETTVATKEVAATLPNGTMVELLGVCPFPRKAGSWWRPEGSPLHEAPYDRIDQFVAIPDKDKNPFEVALRVRNLPGDCTTAVQSPGTNYLTSDNLAHKAGEAQKDLRWVIVEAMPNQATCTVRCYVIEPWKVLARSGPQISASDETPDADAVFSGIREDPGRMVTVGVTGRVVDPNQHRFSETGETQRIVVVKKNGEIGETPLGNFYAYETPDSVVATFPRLSLEEIQELQFQVRTITYAQFENVPLRPGLKTDVQARVRSKDASIMPAGMVGTWLFENSIGDDEQMAVFPDGRVVVLYANGHKEETRYDRGYITLGQYRNARARMVLDANGTILHYFGGPDTDVHGKRWRRIASEPRTDLSAPPAGAGTQRADAASEPILLSPPIEVVLPEADGRTVPVILDLATGELVPQPPTGPEPAKMQWALREMGKGDIVYDVDLGDRSIILLRDAASEQAQEETGEPGIKGHSIGRTLPETLIVTTREGRRYEVTILAADEKACTLRYSPLSLRPGPKTDVQVSVGSGDAADVPKGTAGTSTREVILPDVDHEAAMLDLATGRLVPVPAVESPVELLEAIRKLGKGDIVFDGRSLILVRGAMSKEAEKDPTGLVTTIRIGPNLPEIHTVTTAEGQQYGIEVLSADDKACTLKYSPLPLDQGPGGGTLVEPGRAEPASEAKPSDPNFAVRLPNGVAVELLAYSRLGQAGLEWWTPRGERTTIPDIYEADAEGHGNLIALRVEPEPEYVLAWSYQPPDVYRELKIWRMNDSNIRLAALGQERNYVNIQIYARVQDPPRTQIIRVDRRKADGSIHIDRYGDQRITELTTVGSDATEFTLRFTAEGPRVVAVVDASRSLHPVRLLPAALRPPGSERRPSSREQRYQADVPLKDLGGIVIEGRAARGGEVKFRNLSLIPEQPTQVQVEVPPEEPGPMWFASGLDAKLSTLADALSVYAQSHAGRYPANLSELRGQMGQENHEFVEQHMVYLGAGKTAATATGSVLAYAKTLLPFGFGTYVLYGDRRVEFELPAKLKELGIPAGKQAAAAGGALELRIVPRRSDLAAEVVEQCIRALKIGQTPAEGRYVWAAIPPVVDPSPDVIVATHDGKTWLLLHNEESFIMYPTQGWKATDLALYADPSGRPMVRLDLDRAGAARITQLTQAHHRSLAILVDGAVVSAPVLTSPELRSVAIAGPFTPEQIDQVLAAFKKGMIASTVSGIVSRELLGRVLDPDGRTAAGAQVALITAEARVTVRDGWLEPPQFGSEEKAQVVETDAEGLFRFESEPNDAFSLVAAHEAGFAIVGADAFRAGHEVRLEPWGRIEGRVAEGRGPVENKIWMGGLPNETWLKHRRDYRYETLSDAAGQFTFEKVPPGRFEVGYLLRSGDWSSSLTSRTPVVVKSGQTAKVTLGGEGQPVIGRFVPPEGYSGSIYFGAGLRALQTRRPDPPRPPDYDQMTKRRQQEWTTNWWRNAEARAYSEAIWSNPNWRAYTFRVDRDGSFRIEDVIPGEYDLTVWLEERDSSQGRPEEIGGYSGTIIVPPMAEASTDQPLDLGDLTLSMRNPLHVGDTAPLFEAKSLDGRDIRLIDYRGRFVLLSFWSPVFHPERDRLKELHKTYGATGKLAIIDFALRDTLQEVRSYLDEHEIEWPEVYLGEEGDSDIAQRYGNPVASYILLVDPEGKIIATWLRDEKLTKAVREALDPAGLPLPSL